MRKALFLCHLYRRTGISSAEDEVAGESAVLSGLFSECPSEGLSLVTWGSQVQFPVSHHCSHFSCCGKICSQRPRPGHGGGGGNHSSEGMSFCGTQWARRFSGISCPQSNDVEKAGKGRAGSSLAQPQRVASSLIGHYQPALALILNGNPVLLSSQFPRTWLSVTHGTSHVVNTDQYRNFS